MNDTLRAVTISLAVLFVQLPVMPVAAQEPPHASNLIEKLKISVPGVALQGVSFELTVQALDADDRPVKSAADSVWITNISTAETSESPVSAPLVFRLEQGQLTVPEAVLHQTGTCTIAARSGAVSAESSVRVLPGILSLMPPLIAIALAFITRQTLISLFCGIWLGTIFIYDYNPLLGFMKTIDTYLSNALADSDNAAVLIFSLTLGGMVGVISKAGGTQGIVEKLSQFAHHPRGGQLATWAMGLLIFFDDYANTLIVGNTMRPFTDRLRISREKLSYIVDSTAAPVASIALISTWIGYQIGLIDQAFDNLELNQNAYAVFLQSIPYATYSILALFFVFLIAFSLRDFGPMRSAEQRAWQHGKVLRDGAQPITESGDLDLATEGTPLRWYNAILPILTVIVVTLVGLYYSGAQALAEQSQNASIGQIFGAADSFSTLMWASFAGLLVAGIAALSQGLMTLSETIDAAVRGYKSMMLAAMILLLAWAIGDICEDLHTANYVITYSRDILSPHFIPFLTFVVAAFISFSTGSSWATMAILTPIVIPIAYHLPGETGLDAQLGSQILIGTVGSILSGSVLGDHCSPISDTTILSSMASAADHVDHVRTQMPYALVVGLVASLVGYIPTGWGFNAYFSLATGAVLLVGVILLMGKKVKVETFT